MDNESQTPSLVPLSSSGDSATILFQVGRKYFERGEYDRAVEQFSRVVALQPEEPLPHLVLGMALQALGRLAAAAERFRTALRLRPEDGDAAIALGSVLMEKEQWSEAIFYLKQGEARRPGHADALLSLAKAHLRLEQTVLANVYMQLAYYHSQTLPPRSEENDAYFLHPEEAQRVAQQQNRLRRTILVSTIQLCYYPGPALVDAPANLINVPLAEVPSFFKQTRWRRPTTVRFDPANPEERETALMLAESLELADRYRRVETNRMVQACRQLQPVFAPEQPLRVFLHSSRLTTVMQYSSAGLARAFGRLGCEVFFSIEPDEREDHDMYLHIQKFLDFNPHLVMDINYRSHGWISPAVFDLLWWQDPMPELLQGNPFPWRERDLIYSAHPHFDDLLRTCGAPEVQRQGYCIDGESFHRRPEVERKPLVVFIGTSSRRMPGVTPAEREVMEQLREMVRQGQTVTSEEIARLSARFAVEESRIQVHLLYAVVREETVHWLCRCHDLIEVEIYGRLWDEDPEVRPFFKGELPHGPAVAEVYNRASHTLIGHGVNVVSQRLLEAAACGSIPVVWDDGGGLMTEAASLLEESCLSFHTLEELRHCLTSRPRRDPVDLAVGATYDSFAESLLNTMKQKLGWNNLSGYLP